MGCTASKLGGRHGQGEAVPSHRASDSASLRPTSASGKSGPGICTANQTNACAEAGCRAPHVAEVTSEEPAQSSPRSALAEAHGRSTATPTESSEQSTGAPLPSSSASAAAEADAAVCAQGSGGGRAAAASSGGSRAVAVACSSGGSSGGGGRALSTYGLTQAGQPESLNDLKLGAALGSGSFGTVYRGLWHGARVAVKVLDVAVDAPAPSDPSRPSLGGVAGPLREALWGHELQHPHIVAHYDYAVTDAKEEAADDEWEEGMDDLDEEQQQRVASVQQSRQWVQRIWIIQQFCSLGTLGAAIEKGWLQQKRDPNAPPNLLAILQTAQEIASALSYLHSRGIVHGDLSSNNVLLNSSMKDARRFTAQVGDFGLARVLAGASSAIASKLGTASHMPPEAFEEGEVTKACDAYGYGVLLHEMWNHRLAWSGVSPALIIHNVTSGIEHGQLEMPSDAPPAYTALVVSCLDRDRMRRPTFPEVLERVDGMLAEAREAAKEGL